MKRIIYLFACLLCGMPMFSERVLLKRGTPVYIKLTDDIRSTDSNPHAMAIVALDVVSPEGKVLIPCLTPVNMNVEVERGKTKGRPGYIRLTAMNTTAVDGKTIPLYGSHSLEGEDRKTLAYSLGFGTGFIPFPGIGFAFLAIKGEDVVLKKNTQLYSIIVANDCLIDL
ncbi:MAG: hypothetical protein ACI4BD_08485 [Paludibacteraceae bacterium]